MLTADKDHLPGCESLQKQFVSLLGSTQQCQHLIPQLYVLNESRPETRRCIRLLNSNQTFHKWTNFSLHLEDFSKDAEKSDQSVHTFLTARLDYRLSKSLQIFQNAAAGVLVPPHHWRGNAGPLFSKCAATIPTRLEHQLIRTWVASIVMEIKIPF